MCTLRRLTHRSFYSFLTMAMTSGKISFWMIRVLRVYVNVIKNTTGLRDEYFEIYSSFSNKFQGLWNPNVLKGSPNSLLSLSQLYPHIDNYIHSDIVLPSAPRSTPLNTRNYPVAKYLTTGLASSCQVVVVNDHPSNRRKICGHQGPDFDMSSFFPC